MTREEVRSGMNRQPKIKGEVKNICKQCGAGFSKVYYEGETQDLGEGDYCLACIFGLTKELNDVPEETY